MALPPAPKSPLGASPALSTPLVERFEPSVPRQRLDEPGRVVLRPEFATPESPGSPLDGLTACAAIYSLIRATSRGSVFGIGALREEATPRPWVALPEPAGATLNELQATPAPASYPRWRRSFAGGAHTPMSRSASVGPQDQNLRSSSLNCCHRSSGKKMRAPSRTTRRFAPGRAFSNHVDHFTSK